MSKATAVAPSELDKAVEYTKQFIEAATPIAKQAYELGLLTLRIDAAQGLLSAVLVALLCYFIVRRVRSDWAAASEKAALDKSRYSSGVDDHLPMMGVPHVFVGLGALVIGTLAVFSVLNVWNWTKLFAPQIWLAHQAIEKLVK